MVSVLDFLYLQWMSYMSLKEEVVLLWHSLLMAPEKDSTIHATVFSAIDDCHKLFWPHTPFCPLCPFVLFHNCPCPPPLRGASGVVDFNLLLVLAPGYLHFIALVKMDVKETFFSF